MTRLSDDGEACRTTCGTRPHGTTTEAELAASVLSIATGNLWNRLNVTTRQPVGAAW